MLNDAFVDIKNGAGTKTGGPLPVASWNVTRRVDRAGAFEFTTPFNATATAAIVVKAKAEIYAYINGAYTLVGSGTIDSIEQAVGADDMLLLRVSGDDQLRELATRTCGNLLLAQDDVLKQWTKVTNVNSQNSIVALFTVPGTSTLLAGTAGATGEQIYRSVDNGATWELVFTGNTTAGYAIRCFARTLTATTVLAGGNGGVYRSTDSGATWVSVSSTACYSLVSVFSNFNQVFGDGAGNVYRSTDSGATWSAAIATGVGARPIYDLKENGATLDLLAASSNRYIARSTDQGSTWVSPIVQFGAGDGAIAYCLLYTTTSFLAGTDTGYVIRSTSSPRGASWSAGVQISTSPVRSLIAYGSDIIAGAGGKVYRSTDNGVSFAEVGTLGSATTTYALLALANSVLAGTNETAALYSGVTLSIAITHAAAVAALLALAPAGWSFTADGTPGNDSIYIQFAGESVLAGALLVAERSRGHCYLSGDKALTFADTWTSSGVHAIAPLQGQPLVAEVCGIGTLAITQTAYDVVTRIYPRTRGNVGIALSSIAPGTGYAKDTTAEYVQHTAAVAAYGVIEAWIVFEDIADPDPATTAALTEVGNALVRAAVTWLEQRRAPLTNYRLTLLGCGSLLEPMETVRVSYMRDGWNLDATLNILEATWSGDERGVLTTELVVADSVYWIDDDQATVARAVARVNGLAAR